MFSIFSRSFKLVKESFRVLKKDKEILLFPLLGSISMIVLFILFLFSGLFLGLFSFLLNKSIPIYLLLVLLFLLFFGVAFVSIFTQACVITCAYIRFKGGDPKFSDGLANASKHIKQIILWALISASIGFILSLSSSRRKSKNILATDLTKTIVGGAWSLLTTFVVPLMVIEGKGVKEAIKSSAFLFKKAWGELVIGNISLALIFVLIGIPSVLIPILCLTYFGFHWFWLVVAGIGFICLVLMRSSLNGILLTALYLYASSGKVPSEFSEDLIKNAFVSQRGVGMV